MNIEHYMNYFKLFNLPEKFNIEVAVLSKKFYQLQRKFHPDLFNNHSSLVKIKVLNNSIMINKGYRTLKDPLTRAEHLLSLRGFNIFGGVKMVCEQDFLIEQLNFHQEIDLLKQLPFNLDHFNILLKRINEIKKSYECNMKKEFEIQSWDKAAKILSKLFFFKNLEDSLDKLKK